MKHFLTLFLGLFLAQATLHAQAVSINTDGTAPAASAILDVKSSDKGVLVPRMTTAQRTAIAAPANGLLVFDTNTNSFWFYNGAAWTSLAGGGMPATFIADTDGNTKVQVEKNPNEDIIRFDLAGTESMVLRKNASGSARLELPDAAHSTSVGQDAGANNIPVPGISGENNTLVGYHAGYGNTTGYGNSATGASSLAANTSGSLNTANGVNALAANSTGNENLAIGSYALTSNTTGSGNTAIGSNSLLNNTSGSFNTALGTNALLSVTTADYNTALGHGALNKNTDGNFNLAAGSFALENNTTGVANTALGQGALRKNTSGSGNIAIGDALGENTTGAFNVAAGSGALQSNTTGSSNIAIGHNALPFNGSGSANIAIGRAALYHATKDMEVVAIGDSALFHLNYPATSGGSFNTAVGSRALFSETGNGYGQNTAVGYQSMYFNTTGNENTAIGITALYSNTTGRGNTALGPSMFFNTTGEYNTASGYAALDRNTTGSNNSAYGSGALYLNTTGNANNAFGGVALQNNTTGFNNNAFGAAALKNNTTGASNAAFGDFALQYNTTGSNNAAVGSGALQNNTTGRWNTGMGDNTNTSLGNLDGATALGTSAIVNASNKVVIGANVAGMVIGGYANWSNLSDGRFKEDIRENVPGLAFINRLRPVTYWINTAKVQRHITAEMPDSIAQRYLPDAAQAARDRSYIHTGFVAQEVENSARAIHYNFDGVNAPQNPTDHYSISYGQFVPSLVKAVQEQQTILDAQAAEIKNQTAENRALRDRMTQLEAQINAQAVLLEQISAALRTTGNTVKQR